MTRIIQFALAGLCAGLLLVITAEVFHAVSRNDSAAVEAVESTTAKIKRTAPGAVTEAIVDVILARPLFSASRHPPVEVSAANPEEISEAAPPQLHGRLAGVMIRPGMREALFARVGQRPIAVKVGGEIDGWMIAAIELDRVILSGAFGSQTLRPTKDPHIVRPLTRATQIALGMGPPKSSATRSAGAFTPSAQVARQIEQ
jgi:hypothetical protein